MLNVQGTMSFIVFCQYFIDKYYLKINTDDDSTHSNSNKKCRVTETDCLVVLETKNVFFFSN